MLTMDDFKVEHHEDYLTLTKTEQVLKVIAPKEVQPDVLEAFEDTLALYNGGVIAELHQDLIDFLDSAPDVLEDDTIEGFGVIEDKSKQDT